ncbi:HEAT repeat domain-containing protein [Streptomyces lomondensis]|uniref:HEAT repeat protein n=1 Tax=Streptomyces lomondensis TaxID=68229 RepID=A0ABQ2XR52_9ACTN|nr:HEAT repeat domain-containing protein [Streptomyces lomondensis]MCF0080795.1 HEAT repeat domain-containing protein [Streptomyces lomondensis]GGX28932.1 hypothetical protein GCM10010383_69380 [Streptomyces lomondensis]
MWEGLDEVDWAGLEHNYGSARDLSGLLRRCARPPADQAEYAAEEVLNLLFHQGGWICSAAPAALPFLLRLAAHPDVPCRRTVLDLVSMLAAEAAQVPARSKDPGWAPAWERALPDVLALLADPDPRIRRGAADTIADCESPGEATLPALLRCWHTEDDLATRLDLVLALGRSALREPAGARAAEALALVRGLLGHPEPQLRLAAVQVLAVSDPDLPTRALDDLLVAVRDPSVAVWRHTSSVENGTMGVQHWTAGLFPGASATFVRGLLADHPDPEHRIGALAQAGELLVKWRSPARDLLPALAARLDDPVAEVRYRAAELLACLGPSAAAHADAVAGLLDDDAARTARAGETVADAALWALARMNDPRCLPGLIACLAGAPSGFPPAAQYFGGDFHHPSLPALHEALVLLPDHAGTLVPAVCDRLGTATDPRVRNGLAEVLAAWGPAAEAAVPRLTGLLEDERTWASAATALAGIGVADTAARDLLLTRTATGGADAELAAWAYWRLGGEPGPALAVLGPAATEGDHPHPALRKLADLGPHAAGHADRLRRLTTASDAWTRVRAAHALWAATGDTAHTLEPLLAAVRPLAEGICLPVMLPAVRCLTLMGRAARPAAHLLSAVPALDERLRFGGGRRAFTDDESLRAAVDDLLAAAS